MMLHRLEPPSVEPRILCLIATLKFSRLDWVETPLLLLRIQRYMSRITTPQYQAQLCLAVAHLLIPS